MTLVEVFKAAPWLFVAVAVLLGLVVGSFLNVVIHRLPKMLERQWRAECAELAGAAAAAPPSATTSSCRAPPARRAATASRALENIPLRELSRAAAASAPRARRGSRRATRSSRR